MRFFLNHYVPCILWIKHIGRISPSIFILFSGAGGEGVGGGEGWGKQQILSPSHLLILFVIDALAWVSGVSGGTKREKSNGEGRERKERNNSLSLTPPSFRTEYVKGWGDVCVIANGKPVLTSGKVCSPYPPPALFHNLPCIFAVIFYLLPAVYVFLRRRCIRSQYVHIP